MLVLASSSPRRSELLRNADIPFEVLPADIPEDQKPHEKPLEFAMRLARAKADAVAQWRPQAFVLGADTIVVVENKVLGKPKDSEDAARMLRLLSDREHDVTTAICLIFPDASERITTSETTRVYFSHLSDEDIADYVATNEPMDKAGAYAIQGIAGRWIEKIEGDYFNVVGLPVSKLYRILRQSGALK
jgi:septum formation protein